MSTTNTQSAFVGVRLECVRTQGVTVRAGAWELGSATLGSTVNHLQLVRTELDGHGPHLVCCLICHIIVIPLSVSHQQHSLIYSYLIGVELEAQLAELILDLEV